MFAQVYIFARSTTTFRFSENAIRENTGLVGRGAVNANHRLTLLSRTPLLDATVENFAPIATLSPHWRESQQPAGSHTAALSAGKARFQSNVTRRIKSKRLAGGGRSPSRTPLRQNSLLTGKNTGNYRRLLETLVR